MSPRARISRGASAILLAFCVRASPAAAQQGGRTYSAMFDELRHLSPRPDRVATVRNLDVRRDVARFHLGDGTLVLLSDVAGRTIGAAFVGSGSVSFAAPIEVERNRARRILGDSIITGPITAAVFLFTDTTLTELQHLVSFAPAPADSRAADRVKDALDFLVDGHEGEADPTLMSALLDSTANGWFAGYIKRQHGEDLMIKIDPFDGEEVQLLRRGRLEGQRAETVCQFPRAEELAAGAGATARQPDPLHLDGYRIDARIDGGYHFAAAVNTSLTARQETGRWTRFELFEELDVDSVQDSEGRALEFYRANRGSGLWVRFDSASQAGQTRTFRMVYHGPLLERGTLIRQLLPAGERVAGPAERPVLPDNWVFLRTTWSWFPRYGESEPADMDMTFRTPRDLEFAASGRLVDSSTSGDTRVTHWVSDAPTQVASFSIGDFQRLEIHDPRIPPVTVFMNQQAHDAIEAVIHTGRSARENVASDVANSLSFFTRTFGPPLAPQFVAAEIPDFHGEAFPGLIHLSWWTFLERSSNGEDESFRAHEMAHQWWGIGVEPATYRDWWLAEGFAEFSGLWYMQLVLRENDDYFKQLHDAREEIVRQRDRSAPIGLGRRAAENRSGQYELMIYKKGAWVLHMLRNLMVDPRTMSDEQFGRLLHDFYTTYRGRSASTADFQRLCEERLGGPMGWFFREWVDGTAIPTYTFSWSDTTRADGTHLLRYRVRQDDVPPDFMMIVPMDIQFGDRHALVRFAVRGKVTEGQVSLPAEPTRVEFNPLESVLAQVHEERWHP